MEKALNRRVFLKTSFLGVGTLIASLSPLKIFAHQQTNSTTNLPAIDTAQLYREARAHFYKKEYDLAESKYLQLIEALPPNLEYYDGYAKVLGAKQRMVEIAELYRLALNKYTDNPFFMHRLAVSLKKISRANNKAEKEFITTHGIPNLLSYSAELLLAAIAIKPVKGFMLELKDIPAVLASKNEQRLGNGLVPIELSRHLASAIEVQTDSVKQRWNETRKSRKPLLNTNTDADIKKLSDKKRRELPGYKDREQREYAMKKARKIRWEQALEKGIAENKPTAVDKYGLLILSENIADTQTIGRMRKFYRQNEHPERLISLNRFLFSRNDSASNALSLASSLIKYSKQKKVVEEAKQLLELVRPILDTMPPVCVGDFYTSLAEIDSINGKQADARKTLLAGIGKFDGKGGVAYTLIVRYVATYTGAGRIAAAEIMKALCQKEHKRNNDAVWEFVDKHVEQLKVKPIHNKEKEKYLTALSKFQKAISAAEFNTTMQEILEIKT